MDRIEKSMFKGIVDGFEKHYRSVQQQDSFPDSPTARAAFYNSCLMIVRDGPRLQSDKVQRELVNYYTKLRDEEFGKIVSGLV